MRKFSEDKRQCIIELYEETSSLILGIEADCLRHNRTTNQRERDMLHAAEEFKCSLWEYIINDVNTKDPYKD